MLCKLHNYVEESIHWHSILSDMLLVLLKSLLCLPTVSHRHPWYLFPENCDNFGVTTYHYVWSHFHSCCCPSLVSEMKCRRVWEPNYSCPWTSRQNGGDKRIYQAIAMCIHFTLVKSVLTLTIETFAIKSTWSTLVSFCKLSVTVSYMLDLTRRQL